MKASMLALAACGWIGGAAASADPVRLPTLDDAFGVKSVGSIAANPVNDSFAAEVGGSITVFRSPGSTPLSLPANASAPVWSPNGICLAFYLTVGNQVQLAVWNSKSHAVSVLTHRPDGISPNPWSGSDSSRTISWSHDSRRIAFTSRSMEGYEQVGRVTPIPPVSVYTPSNSGLYGAQTGFFHSYDVWDALGEPDWSDYAPARARAAERNPPFNVDHLYTVDVGDGTSRVVPFSEDCWSPVWSPRSDVIAAICADPQPRTVVTQPFAATSLALFDTASGTRRNIGQSPGLLNDSPAWSPDGARVATIGTKRLNGFGHLQIYDVQRNSWHIEPTQGHSLAAPGFRWLPRSEGLVYRIRDRLNFELWRLPRVGSAVRVNTGDSYVRDFDADAAGGIIYVADGREYSSRIYDSRASYRAPALRYDANPQLKALWFAKRLEVTWTNGRGEPVDGIVLLPPGYQPGRRFPVIADVYPGSVMESFRLVGSSQKMGDLAAAQGYVVFYPAIRAPHGAYAFPRDESYTEKARGAPGIDIMADDFTSGINYLDEAGIADSHRLCLFGHSNGGYTVNFLITETNLARCAVISAGASNCFGTPEGNFNGPGTRDVLFGSNIYDHLDDYVRLSPWFRLDRVSIPVLILGGDRDLNWWLQLSSEFGTLKNLGKDVTWVRYRDEEHYFTDPEAIRDSFARVMDFIRGHIGN